MLLLYGLTMFVGASLLFCVQPMVAKMVLPLLGGSPAVWNTCMVFFQAALLAGYAYAHATTAWLGVRRQAVLHVGLLLLPLLLLPFGVSRDAVQSLPSGANPAPWLLGLLFVMVGLPFFMVSTTAPLLQRWFAETGHPAARDPYFLYGASNLGSMLALLGYPLLMEPNSRLAQQSRSWAVGYGLLAVLTLACAAIVWRSPGLALRGLDDPSAAERPDRPAVGDWLRWVLLAFIPSSLLLGVTTYLTTDIAAIPLLWVIPLALYLLTFILVFARRPVLPHTWMVRDMPMVIVLLTLLMIVGSPQAIWIPVHLLAFFVAAMVCHGELVRSRPAPRHLTEFYLAMSLGGVLGGIFNALIAPIVFDRTVEYPLALFLACLVRPARASDESTSRRRTLDLALPLALGVVFAGLITFVRARAEARLGNAGLFLIFGPAVFLCYTFEGRPVRFAMGVGALLLACGSTVGDGSRILHRERSFFGVLRVEHVVKDGYHRLLHGSTMHGQQSLDPGRRGEPLTYYHRTGPIGDLFNVFRERPARPSVAIVGLGAGSLASYAEPDQHWTVYEIDPAVVRIAQDPRYFTYLRDSRAGALDVVLGDARLRLQDAPDRGYGLIVLDAFSSDAIPMHLLTREAFRLYRAKLATGGLIAFHISNRHLDLAPVLSALARDANLVCRIRRDRDVRPERGESGKSASEWVVLAADESDLGDLAKDPRWAATAARPTEAVWTDDFSNVIEHFHVRLR